MDLMAVSALIIGHAIGDALGVPVEFKKRRELEENPVIDMRGFGTHNVPAGTWSDDTSMTLCLLESLSRLGTVDYDDIMQNFVSWMKSGRFTATDVAFDIGIATRRALMAYAPDSKLITKTKPLQCGSDSEQSNGNGSLMRIAPMALYLYQSADLTWNDMEIVHDVSKLTHAHVRSQMGCGIYVFIAIELIKGNGLRNSIKNGTRKAYRLYRQRSGFAREMDTYSRLWDIDNFARLSDREIRSTGYIVDTLEAAIWCLLTTDNYCECVLKAVNLGDDTDTVGAVTGGLAGLFYGLDNIPPIWKEKLLRIGYIKELCNEWFLRFGH